METPKTPEDVASEAHWNKVYRAISIQDYDLYKCYRVLKPFFIKYLPPASACRDSERGVLHLGCGITVGFILLC